MDKYMRIGIPKKLAESVTSIQEMRKAIFRARRDSAVVARCLAEQEYLGMSGEDTMTMIAFHALAALQAQYENSVDLISLMPVMPKMGDV